MRLKNIRIFGFKSFADRVDVNVDGSLVAVVGPNGCGKSNLVDAIMWALGEISPKNIRAESSADVIFAGSAKRRALGFAEVTLTFDNEQGILPIATTEVVVSRKVDRKGDSHFSINGQSCRLRDIFELFADSGLGRTGYAIVSQNDIDAALSANAEERRTWIDEAAGVQRYRARKIEALKRLDSAINHLQRVNDVISEIETQREPLQKEAEEAKTYKEKLGALREVESGLLIVEASRHKEAIERLAKSVTEKHASAADMRKQADQLDADNRRLRSETDQLEHQIEKLTHNLQREISALDRSESRKTIAEQRRESLSQMSENRSADDELAADRVRKAQAHLNLMRQEFDEAQNAIKVLIQVIAGSDSDSSLLAEKLSKAEEALFQARSQEVHFIEAQAKAAQLSERKKHLERELDGAQKSLPDLKEGAETAEQSVDEARTNLENRRTERDRIENEHANAHRRLSDIEQRRREMLAEFARIEGHLLGLRTSLESFAGLPFGARSVMEAHKSGTLDGDFLPVASALHVPANLAVAIEGALGASAGDLLTSSSEFAKTAIAYLKKEGLGRATFLSADLITKRPRPDGIEKLCAEAGVLGVAADLVKCDSAHKLALELLLGGVLIVENIDVATKLAKRTGFRKIATLGGEVLFAGGALSGGHSAKQSAGFIRTAAEVEQYEADRDALSAKISEVDAESKKVAAEEAEHASRVITLLNEINNDEKAMAEAVDWASSVRHELTTTQRAIERVGAEIVEIQSLLKQIESGDASGDLNVKALEADRNELLALVASTSADTQQARKALQESQERAEAAADRVRLAETELAEADASKASRLTRFSNFEDEFKHQDLAIAEAQREIELAKVATAKAETELSEAKTRRRESQQKSQDLADEANQLRATAVAVDDAAYQDDIQRARQETKLATCLTRLLEEYNTSEEQVFEQASLVSIPPEAEKVVAQLRREIRALGDVNLGAIEAYERLSERYDILFNQRQDILDSKAELDKSVEELDKITRGAFKETFEKVQVAFGENFTKLFGGGEATLELSQPERLLDSGVDIHVQVPGKKTQRLELLSGGERALSACAFLFALLKVKPSPVCVLDELDAPLDGRNVERYVALLKEFSVGSQFIVITHNPTTIEAAPIWFGITMQEPGVSIVIPYRTPGSENGTHAVAPEQISVL